MTSCLVDEESHTDTGGGYKIISTQNYLLNHLLKLSVNLTIKPAIVGCRRLGLRDSQSAIQQHPRRLLVKLRSAETASNLRRASRDLKRRSDPTVSSVYINPDLTKEQALLAYQERQKRRARMSQPSTSHVHATTGNENTQPFH